MSTRSAFWCSPVKGENVNSTFVTLAVNTRAPAHIKKNERASMGPPVDKRRLESQIVTQVGIFAGRRRGTLQFLRGEADFS
jgi:hypothetical protein